MTTNTNPSRTAARFYAAATTNGHGRYEIIDRTDPRIVAAVKGRAAARAHAAALTAINPTDEQGPRPTEAPAAKSSMRTSHADCDHVSTKLARAICRRSRTVNPNA